MRVGVKYCGGCNQTYERVRAVEKMKRKLGQHTFEAYSPDGEYGKVIVVCGCARECVEVNETKNVIAVCSEEDIERATRLLNE